MVFCRENDAQNVKGSEKNKFMSHQWRLITVIIFVNICSMMCYSIQAPFYPSEAKKRGITSSVYGLVFDVFEFVAFILCPIYGKYINHIGPKFMLNAGTFVMAICSILFGFLGKTKRTPFIVLSFIVRITEAIGHAGYITASFAILATQFPDNIPTAFTIAETALAVGIIIGPSVGGLLYEIGGFLLPFAVNGGILIIAAIYTAFILPEIETNQSSTLSIKKLLSIPSIAVCYYTVFAVAFSFGFLIVLCVPFVELEFGLSAMIIGFLCIIPASSYALTTYFWGTLADKHIHPMLINAMGASLTLLAFLLLAPEPFLHIKPDLGLVTVALIVYGIGAAGEKVAAFINSNKEAIRHGFPPDMETYGIISGLWTSGSALGNFVGPIISGFVGDAIGFSNSTLIICFQQALVVLLSLISYRCKK